MQGFYIVAVIVD